MFSGACFIGLIVQVELFLELDLFFEQSALMSRIRLEEKRALFKMELRDHKVGDSGFEKLYMRFCTTQQRILGDERL